MQGMDECYKDFRNQKLTVDICFDWTILGVHGVSDAVREDYLEFMRKSATQ